MYLDRLAVRPSGVALPPSLPAVIRRTLLTTVIFAALDFVWLSLVMGDFYKRHLGELASRAGTAFAPVWWAALLVYIVLIVGVMCFPLHRAGHSVGRALAWGALFGLVTYGTYDLTCQAVFRDWPVVMTVVDMAWGACICGLTSAGVVAADARLRSFTFLQARAE